MPQQHGDGSGGGGGGVGKAIRYSVDHYSWAISIGLVLVSLIVSIAVTPSVDARYRRDTSHLVMSNYISRRVYDDRLPWYTCTRNSTLQLLHKIHRETFTGTKHKIIKTPHIITGSRFVPTRYPDDSGSTVRALDFRHSDRPRHTQRHARTSRDAGHESGLVDSLGTDGCYDLPETLDPRDYTYFSNRDDVCGPTNPDRATRDAILASLGIDVQAYRRRNTVDADDAGDDDIERRLDDMLLASTALARCSQRAVSDQGAHTDQTPFIVDAFIRSTLCYATCTGRMDAASSQRLSASLPDPMTSAHLSKLTLGYPQSIYNTLVHATSVGSPAPDIGFDMSTVHGHDYSWSLSCDLRRAIASNGPVIVGFDTWYSLLLNYNGGIYTTHGIIDRTGILHTNRIFALAIGWGTDITTGLRYFICAMSQGRDWGERGGYFRINENDLRVMEEPTWNMMGVMLHSLYVGQHRRVPAGGINAVT